MASTVQMKLTGFKEVDALLKGLGAQTKRKVLLAGQRVALAPVAKDMKGKLSSSTSRRTGNLEDSIGVKALPGGKEYNATSLAGVRYGGKYKGRHAHFIEEGTKDRVAKKGKMLKFIGEDGQVIFTKKVKGVQARPFMRPAIEQHLPRIEKDYPHDILVGLERYMRRTLKKANK